MTKPQALFVAQPSYAAGVDQIQPWDNLPLAAAAARALAEALESCGYELACPDLLEGGRKDDIERRLDVWFRDAVTPGGCLVFLWTGHGHSDGGQHYLICRNSPKLGVSGLNAIDTSQIGIVIADCPAEKILVVLDTCHSGLAAGNVAESIEKLLATRAQIPGQHRAFAIIASTHALESATEGVLLEALRKALLEERVDLSIRRWTDRDEVINSGHLSKAARLLIPGDVSAPQYVARGDEQDFIPNPRYRRGLSDENVEERLWRLARSDAAAHFELAARGIEVGEKGWFFSGRQRLLKELVDWLKSGEHGIRILTGPPGAGKSAVLGRLATLSDEEYRQAAIRAGIVMERDEAIPLIGAVDVAVHAKGKSLDDCVRALALSLSVPVAPDLSVDVASLVSNIGALNRGLTLVIDALDEAPTGQRAEIVAQLIVPIGRLPRVRVLVGTRRSLDGLVIQEGQDRHSRLRAAFGADAIIDDLEDEQDTDADIAEYVRSRLATSEKHREDSPESLAAVASRVAARAEGIFLYARIVVRTLQEQSRLDGELPIAALEAFEQDITARFRGDERRVDNLLGALAWGEGKGLTRRVWPIVANALAVLLPSYDDDDISWALTHAGWHIIEAGEGGQAVYRLAHQKLADYYRARFDEGEAQDRIVTALRGDLHGPSWLDCDKYLWRHLSDHAQLDQLTDLIKDPGYLAVADPTKLVTALPKISSLEGRRFARIYNRVVDRLVGQSPAERMPLLHLAAQREDPQLASALEPPIPTRWRCRWARGRPSTSHRIIGKHSAEVSGIAWGAMHERVVVASAGRGDMVGLWDAKTGQPIGQPLERNWRHGKSVAWGVLDGQPAVVSIGYDTVRLWDPWNGEVIWESPKHSTSVNLVAWGAIDGRPIVVSASWNTVQLWDANTGKPIGPPLEGHKGRVSSLAYGTIDGRPMIVSGGADKTVRLWNAEKGESIGGPLEGHTDEVRAVTWGELDGQPTIASGAADGIRVWEARTRNLIWSRTRPFTWSIAWGVIGGEQAIATGSVSDTQLFSARSGEQIGSILKGHTSSVSSVAWGVIDGEPVLGSGSMDGTIRVWEVRASEPVATEPKSEADLIDSVMWGGFKNQPVVVSSGLEIRQWDAKTGEQVGRPIQPYVIGMHQSLALGEIDGQPVVVCGNIHDAAFRLWDLTAAEPIGQPFAGHSKCVTSLAWGEINGRPAIVSGSEDKTIRLWDPSTREPIGKPLEGHEDQVLAVAWGEIAGRPIVASGGADTTIRVWDPLTGEPIGKPLEGHTSWVRSISLAVIQSRLVLVSGGDGIRLWEAEVGREGLREQWADGWRQIDEPLEEHRGQVNAVACGVTDGRLIVASAREDGTVTRWDIWSDQKREQSVVAIGDPVRSIDMNRNGDVVVGMFRGMAVLEFPRIGQF